MKSTRIQFSPLASYWFLGIIWAGLCIQAQAQYDGEGKVKYWIEFQDKGDLSQYDATRLLSPEAHANRQRKGIEIDFRDYPVHAAYWNTVCQTGIELIHTSRWINSVSAYMTPEEVFRVQQFPFVKTVHPVAVSQGVADIEMECDSLPDFDTPTQQLSMVGLDELHAQGYTGEGVTIAVFDNGYLSANQLATFRPIFESERVIATRDFVDGDADVFSPCAHCRHGTWVWSILASQPEEGFSGSAPGASFILLRTENDDSETHQEEDNWLAAAEYADSLGAQVFSTSLGYFTFDPGEGNYTQADLDGNTTIITRAADLAASRGIIVVNSAGNSGAIGLSAPADGDSVIAVAAVDVCEERANFSSHGFVTPLKVKPDISAQGRQNYFYDTAGNLRRGNGTSYSCPIISGLMACLLQAHPDASYGDLYQAMIRSADRFASPDSLYGYGIPHAAQAHAWLSDPTNVSDPTGICSYVVYPNPTRQTTWIATVEACAATEIEFELRDLQGRLVFSLQQRIQGQTAVSIPAGISPGLYFMRIKESDQKDWTFQEKLIVQE